MFPQLVNYQASLPPPPPPPPACPTGCPSTCYPNCDAGCCFPVNQPPAYPQYSPYMGYDPCVAQSCSAACAPQCQPGMIGCISVCHPLISLYNFCYVKLNQNFFKGTLLSDRHSS